MTDANSLDLAEDGRVILTLETGTITLKVPKVKEYKALMKALTGAQRELTAITAIETKYDADRKAAIAAGEPIEDDDHETPTPSDFYGPYLQLAIETLGDGAAVPEVDDFPVWLVETAEAINLITVHWRTVPLGRGGRVPPR